MYAGTERCSLASAVVVRVYRWVLLSGFSLETVQQWRQKLRRENASAFVLCVMGVVDPDLAVDDGRKQKESLLLLEYCTETKRKPFTSRILYCM